MRNNNLEVDLGAIAAIIKFFDDDGDGNITLQEIERKGENAELSAGMMSLPTDMNNKVLTRILTNNEFASPKKSKRNIDKDTVLDFLGKLILQADLLDNDFGLSFTKCYHTL